MYSLFLTSVHGSQSAYNKTNYTRSKLQSQPFYVLWIFALALVSAATSALIIALLLGYAAARTVLNHLAFLVIGFAASGSLVGSHTEAGLAAVAVDIAVVADGVAEAAAGIGSVVVVAALAAYRQA